MALADRIVRWAKHWQKVRLLRRFGGIQDCCWCRQIAQSEGGWHFDAWARDPMLDVLTCGVCGGTSLWKWELGMIWIGPLDPPKPKHGRVPFYDIEQARLSPTTGGERAEP